MSRVFQLLIVVVVACMLLDPVSAIRPRIQHTIEALNAEHAASVHASKAAASADDYSSHLTMKQTSSNDESVSFSSTKGDTITTITMKTAPTYAKSKDHSLLSTRSRVGGPCAKPMCNTVGPWQTKCIESVCYPLCLGTVYDISVEGGANEKFTAELALPVHQNAIQGVLLGIGCSEHTGCCPKDARLATWTESKLQNANQYGLPLPYCKHTKDRAAACAGCTGATVTVKPKGGEICEHHYKPMDIGAAEAAWGRAGIASAPPAHKSFKEKCKGVDDEVTAAKGDMEAAFNGYVCGCLGCCDDQECPYKVAFSSVAEAEGNQGGTGQK